uniref:Uncharacterized protein n=1 Tax=viral metagenome TaxID=1070528 RepID=A0A6C0I5S7_9ZZZZ
MKYKYIKYILYALLICYILRTIIYYKINKTTHNINNYLEHKGIYIANEIYNPQQSNTYIINNINNNKKMIKKYNPFVIRISNIIIGRFDIKNNKQLINTIYEYVEHYTIKNKCKINIADNHKYNEIIDKITLYISRILFKITEDPLTKILIGQYIIKNTNNNNEIDMVYLSFINISKNTRLSVDVRMNAIDLLNLSNNKKYMELSKTLLQNIRNETRNNITTTSSVVFNNNLQRIANNRRDVQVTRNIQTQQIPLTQQTAQTPQFLVDRDGTRYPIPRDINVPPIPRIIEVKKPSSSIYDDGQNVHNSTINQTTLNTASELINKYNPYTVKLDFVYYKTKSFDELPPAKIEKVDKSIHRINTDTATFGKGFTLYTLYQSLLNLIDKHPQKNDLNERLLDELIDMSGKCSTGHLSRLVNVLQGFDTDINVKVKININDEIYAKIKHVIEKNIVNADNMDELMEDMLSENKTEYIKYVKDLIDTKIEEIIKEYEHLHTNDIIGYNGKATNIQDIVTEIIIQSLDKYTGTQDHFQYLNIRIK